MRKCFMTSFLCHCDRMAADVISGTGKVPTDISPLIIYSEGYSIASDVKMRVAILIVVICISDVVSTIQGVYNELPKS